MGFLAKGDCACAREDEIDFIVALVPLRPTGIATNGHSQDN
jgi:hypothetical protein